MGLFTQLRPFFEERPWVLTSLAFICALSFLAGCLCFYDPALQTAGTTLFLIGSLCMLGDAIGLAALTHGRRDASQQKD